MIRYLLPSALIAFAIDHFSKWVIVCQINLKDTYFIEVWPGVFNLAMGWNRGINFGLFANNTEIMRWGLVVLAAVICAIVIYWMRNERKPIVFISTGLLVGGALGNVADRIMYGAVADFINVTCCGIENPTSFNIADAFVFIGVVGLLLFSSKK